MSMYSVHNEDISQNALHFSLHHKTAGGHNHCQRQLFHCLYLHYGYVNKLLFNNSNQQLRTSYLVSWGVFHAARCTLSTGMLTISTGVLIIISTGELIIITDRWVLPDNTSADAMWHANITVDQHLTLVHRCRPTANVSLTAVLCFIAFTLKLQHLTVGFPTSVCFTALTASLRQATGIRCAVGMSPESICFTALAVSCRQMIVNVLLCFIALSPYCWRMTVGNSVSVCFTALTGSCLQLTVSVFLICFIAFTTIFRQVIKSRLTVSASVWFSDITINHWQVIGRQFSGDQLTVDTTVCCIAFLMNCRKVTGDQSTINLLLLSACFTALEVKITHNEKLSVNCTFSVLSSSGNIVSGWTWVRFGVGRQWR